MMSQAGVINAEPSQDMQCDTEPLRIICVLRTVS